MSQNCLKYIFSILCLASGMGLSIPASAQDTSIKSGESVDIFAVYWIANCRSILKNFVGIDVLEGPPGVALSLREEPVRTSQRQNCPDSIPGATVVATAKDVTERSVSTLRFRVRYNTDDGQKQSNHSLKLFLYPQ